jgi:mono/diheme cytochrome c family protein
MSRRTGLLGLLVMFASSQAQAQGDPRAGLVLAREVCASCHNVLAGQSRSPDRNAPSFQEIASVPGMTPLALTVVLQTSHKTMPNTMLDPSELRNVIAYITSLKGDQ